MSLGSIKIIMPVYNKINDLNVYSKTYNTNFIPLTQKELYEGWLQLVPKSNKKSTLHHFSISLCELPSNLWLKIKKFNNTNLYIIKNGVYEYSIPKTDIDHIIFDLYDEINKTIPNNNIILNYYNLLKPYNLKGWLIYKVENYLENCNF